LFPTLGLHNGGSFWEELLIPKACDAQYETKDKYGTWKDLFPYLENRHYHPLNRRRPTKGNKHHIRECQLLAAAGNFRDVGALSCVHCAANDHYNVHYLI